MGPWYQSDISREFAASLGMVTIEFNALELTMSETLRHILSLGDTVNAHKLTSALYYTPKSNTGRIDLLKNVIPLAVKDDAFQKRLLKLCDRALSVAARRHEAAHALWHSGTKGDETGVFKTLLPKRPSVPVDVTELERLVEDCRSLIMEFHKVFHDMGFINILEFQVDEHGDRQIR